MKSEKFILPAIRMVGYLDFSLFTLHFSLTLREFTEIDFVHVAFLDEGVVEGVGGSEVVP